jgi:hypothetical protein
MYNQKVAMIPQAGRLIASHLSLRRDWLILRLRVAILHHQGMPRLMDRLRFVPLPIHEDFHGYRVHTRANHYPAIASRTQLARSGAGMWPGQESAIPRNLSMHRLAPLVRVPGRIERIRVHLMRAWMMRSIDLGRGGLVRGCLVACCLVVGSPR